ncbi:MAG: GNAT family N-acetyltransferase [Planctomycetes bacterium]|nr:GNAT family N-acetyltransferase [Planctomycetota bacterium]
MPGDPHTPPLDQLRGGYRLRFAQGERDLDAVQRLRFEVFNLEIGEGLAESHLDGRDRDRFDAQCQHLMIEEAASGVAVGTYRLQVAAEAAAKEGLYSAGEFDLSRLPAAFFDQAVELGRACITRPHRDTRVLGLLWKGLATYMIWNRKRRLFGCNSLTSQDPADGLRLWQQLQDGGHAHADLRVEPLPGLACLGQASDHPVEVPTLFGIYLRYGSKVLGPPAIDRDFGTIDFLTTLDLALLDPRVLEDFAR